MTSVFTSLVNSSKRFIGFFTNAIGKISSIHFTGIISRPFLTLSGISCRSFTLSLGIKTVFTPALSAAKSFSFKPPISKISPWSVISPVMATSGRTGILVKAETMAVVIAPPALGPSFGVAPSGKCKCQSVLPKMSESSPRLSARARTTLRAASTDSFITSPRLPVRWTCPLPGNTAASIWSKSPPTSVQANPA